MRKTLIALVSALAAAAPLVAAPSVVWIATTAEKSGQLMPAPAFEPARADEPPTIYVSPDRLRQTIDGFGGCFNEHGWQALSVLPQSARDEVVRALFGPDGANFNLARIPIGASDFALDAYSLADTPEDYELKHFSTARDEKLLLPYIQAALATRSDLRCWASPWSPPAWMKTNRSYAKGSLRWEPRVLRTYADYFARWVEAYKAKGVPIYAIAPQNEPNIASPYPTCLWSGPELREFIADYLGPVLRERHPDVELWLGLNGDPVNGGENPNARLITVLEDPRANSFLTGIAFQYDRNTQIGLAYELYPQKKLMQSETKCNGGANSWDDAFRLFGELKRYLSNGANAYFAWNMVLNETGMSTWDWKQNALVTVHRDEARVAYNGEYHVLSHFSRYVRPGARRIVSTGLWGDQIAFVNPDRSVVVVAANSSPREHTFTVAVAGRPDRLRVKLPPRSVHTFILPPAEPKA